MKKETKKTKVKTTKKVALKTKARKPAKVARKRPIKRKGKRDEKKMHTSRCSVCKSEHRKIIEARYKSGEPGWKIVDDYRGISNSGLGRHAKFFQLKIKRDNEAFLDRLLMQADEDGLRLDERSLLPALKMSLQKDGKVPDDPAKEINLKIQIEQERKEKQKRGLERFGITLVEENESAG